MLRFGVTRHVQQAQGFKDDEHRERNALGKLDVLDDIGTRQQRLGQPLLNVLLALPGQRAEPVERQPGDYPDNVLAR